MLFTVGQTTRLHLIFLALEWLPVHRVVALVEGRLAAACERARGVLRGEDHADFVRFVVYYGVASMVLQLRLLFSENFTLLVDHLLLLLGDNLLILDESCGATLIDQLYILRSDRKPHFDILIFVCFVSHI